MGTSNLFSSRPLSDGAVYVQAFPWEGKAWIFPYYIRKSPKKQQEKT